MKENDSYTEETTAIEAADGALGRRSVLKITGAATKAGLDVAGGLTEIARASFDVSDGGKYEIWTVSGQEVYDFSDGEDLSNVLVIQTAEGARLKIQSRDGR